MVKMYLFLYFFIVKGTDAKALNSNVSKQHSICKSFKLLF